MLWSFSIKIMFGKMISMKSMKYEKILNGNLLPLPEKVQLGRNMQPNPQKYGLQHLTRPSQSSDLNIT